MITRCVPVPLAIAFLLLSVRAQKAVDLSALDTSFSSALAVSNVPNNDFWFDEPEFKKNT
jgi:hypothetical protein